MAWIKDVYGDFINTDFIHSIVIFRSDIRAYYGAADDVDAYYTLYEDEDADQDLLNHYMKGLQKILGVK